MTRRYIQLELAARYTRPFSLEAGRLNRLAVDMERAQHERRRSPLATRYRRALQGTPDAGIGRGISPAQAAEWIADANRIPALLGG